MDTLFQAEKLKWSREGVNASQGIVFDSSDENSKVIYAVGHRVVEAVTTKV